VARRPRWARGGLLALSSHLLVAGASPGPVRRNLGPAGRGGWRIVIYTSSAQLQRGSSPRPSGHQSDAAAESAGPNLFRLAPRAAGQREVSVARARRRSATRPASGAPATWISPYPHGPPRGTCGKRRAEGRSARPSIPKKSHLETRSSIGLDGSISGAPNLRKSIAVGDSCMPFGKIYENGYFRPEEMKNANEDRRSCICFTFLN
jgi:hypothetical protein